MFARVYHISGLIVTPCLSSVSVSAKVFCKYVHFHLSHNLEKTKLVVRVIEEVKLYIAKCAHLKCGKIKLMHTDAKFTANVSVFRCVI